MSSNLDLVSADVGSNIVSFAAFADTRKRRLIAYDEPRGQVLLFTGVRYERADGGPGAPSYSNGSRPTRRRRRG